MKCGCAASSPRTSRMRLMHQFSPCSKSTNVPSLQTAACSSLRVTSSPARAARIASTVIGCGCSGTRCPSRVSTSCSRSSVNAPNLRNFNALSIDIHRLGAQFAVHVRLSTQHSRCGSPAHLGTRTARRQAAVRPRARRRSRPVLVRRRQRRAQQRHRSIHRGGARPDRDRHDDDDPVRTVAPLDMRIGDVTLKIAEPWVIDLSGVPIPKWVHGLVGAEFFEAYVVELDPERATMRFFDPATFRKPHGAVAVPLEDANHRFFMRVTIDVNGKEHVERRVRIDTGSGDSVGDEIVRKGRRVRETTLGQGLGSDYKSVSGLVDAVHIGPFAVHNVWGPATRFPAIGMEMLRRFTMTFDVPHRALYLHTNAHLGDAGPPPEH